MNPNVRAQTPNWQSAFVKEGTSTSRRRKIASTDLPETWPRCMASRRGIEMPAMTRVAAIESMIAAKKGRLKPPRVSRNPVALVPIICPKEEAKASRDVAKMVRSGG